MSWKRDSTTKYHQWTWPLESTEAQFSVSWNVCLYHSVSFKRMMFVEIHSCGLNFMFCLQGGLTQDEVWLYPMQFHSIVLSLFSSLIAPFGGFFASGFKRAFKVKVSNCWETSLITYMYHILNLLWKIASVHASWDTETKKTFS